MTYIFLILEGLNFMFNPVYINNTRKNDFCQLKNMHTGKFPIEQSNLFISWELEKKAIETFRWLESEKAGFEIDKFHIDWLWWTTGKIKWLETINTGKKNN